MQTNHFTFYRNINERTGRIITISEFIYAIKNADFYGFNWRLSIDELRNPNIPNNDYIKLQLPLVIVSGIYKENATGKDLSNITRHTGFICIDIDGKENPVLLNNLPELFTTLCKDVYTLIAFISPSGTGIKLIVRIPPDINTHLNSYLALENYYLSNYNIVIDKACKNVNRLCFMSYDTNIYTNRRAEKFTRLTSCIKVYENHPQNIRPEKLSDTFTDVQYCIEQLQTHKIDITSNYQDWLKIGFAIADEFGESGRDMFHQVSSVSIKYNPPDCDTQYTRCIQANGQSRIRISSFFYLCKDYGLTVKKPKNERKTA